MTWVVQRISDGTFWEHNVVRAGKDYPTGGWVQLPRVLNNRKHIEELLKRARGKYVNDVRIYKLTDVTDDFKPKQDYTPIDSRERYKLDRELEQLFGGD